MKKNLLPSVTKTLYQNAYNVANCDKESYKLENVLQ